MSNRFPTKTTCLAIYSRVINSGESLGAVLAGTFPWCARMARRLGSDDVHMCYRRTEAEMYITPGEVEEMLTILGRVKGVLRAAQENRDKLFAEVNFSSALSQLDQAWYDIKTAKPFAVCPTCQGQLPDKCTLCKGRGLISEHRWNTCVTREDKEFRVRAKQKAESRK